jgi:cobalt-zinc-cadmium efflux system membrane fusion protein
MSDSVRDDNAAESPAPTGASQAAADPGRDRSAGASGPLTWATRRLPTLFVLVALGALGYAGHTSGWKLPRFSSLNGAEDHDKHDWCDEHDAPEAICVECNPKLMPFGKDAGFCKKHGVHQCPLCNPELAQLKETPIIPPSEMERVDHALQLMERPENNAKCLMYRRRVQFASIESMKKAGVDVDLVEQRPVVEAIQANGEIGYDQTRVTRLSSRVPGTVWRVEKHVGDRVRKGEVLALVDSTDVGRLKSELLAGLIEESLHQKVYARAQSLEQKGVVAGRQAQEAQTELGKAGLRVLSAHQALANLDLPVSLDMLRRVPEPELPSRIRFLGLSDATVASLSEATPKSGLLPITAPADGVLVPHENRPVVAGESVEAGRLLFVVADVSHMWLTLDVRQEDTKYIALGQSVRFRAAGVSEESTADIRWISTAIDEKTRTLKIRADVPNADGRLRAGMFGTGQIVLRDERDAVVVPSSAIHWDGSCHVVFVRDTHFLEDGSFKVFHTRTVRPGTTDDKTTEVIVGLLPGEVVASRGSGILRAALLKNNLGAG